MAIRLTMLKLDSLQVLSLPHSYVFSLLWLLSVGGCTEPPTPYEESAGGSFSLVVEHDKPSTRDFGMEVLFSTDMLRSLMFDGMISDGMMSDGMMSDGMMSDLGSESDSGSPMFDLELELERDLERDPERDLELDLEPPPETLLYDDPCPVHFCTQHGWCNASQRCLCDPGYRGNRCTSCDSGWERRSDRCYPVSGISISSGGGNDTIRGGNSSDHIMGGEGDDALHGGGGEDLVCGDQDNDTLYGGEGRDEVHGDTGDDQIFGGEDADALFGGADRDHIWGGDGDDKITGGGGDDVLRGEEGDDHYVFDGLGTDTIEDASGVNHARCNDGVYVTEIRRDQDQYELRFSNGGVVNFRVGDITMVWGCESP